MRCIENNINPTTYKNVSPLKAGDNTLTPVKGKKICINRIPNCHFAIATICARKT